MKNKNNFLKVGFLSLLALLVCFACFEDAQAEPETQQLSERLELLYDPIRMAEAYTSYPDDLRPEENALASISYLDGWTRTVFQRINGDDFDIFITNGSNSNAVQLTASSGQDLMPRLNRGNTAITYVSGQTGDYHIYTMNVNGGNVQQLTWGSSSNLLPDWSPDGTKILFDSDRDEQTEVYVMNADGSNQTRLTFFGGYDGQASWSPDGNKIVFVGQRNGNYGIWVMNTDGSGQTQLASQPYSYTPFFSPDGQTIVYSADGDNDGWFEIWRMNADGSAQTVVADAGSNYDLLASGWAPDQSYSIHSRIYWVSYGGYWYWRYAYREGITFPENTIKDMGDGIYDWRADWQTTDIEAPATTLAGLPDPSPGPIPLIWTNTEPGGSGIRHYEIETSSQPDGPWTSWQTTAQSSLAYPGEGGETWYFRLRGVDQAFNTENWSTTYDLRANVEALAPISWINPIPLFSRTSVPISWDANDFGPSGLKDFTLQYQKSGGTVWITWLPNTTLTSEIFSGAPGFTYLFRSRAVDLAENVEPWQETDYIHTSFYTWALTGTVTDNTGTWLTGSLPNFQAGGVGGYASNTNGEYHAYGANEEGYELSWARDGYQNLPITSYRGDLDHLQNLVFPPANNIVNNWGFESGAFGNNDWDSTGTLPAEVVTDSHTGNFSALLGEDLAFETPYHLLDGSSQFGVDDQGNVYMLWAEYDYPYGTTIYFRKKYNGSWYPAEVFQADVSYSPMVKLAVEGNGTVHVIWRHDQHLNYSFRVGNGNWSEPTIIVPDTADKPIIALGQNGALHVLFERNKNLFYTQKLPNGLWLTEENLNSGVAENMYLKWLLLDDTQAVHVFYIKEDPTHYNAEIFYAKRSVSGEWATPIKATHDGLQYLHILFVAFTLNGQNLPYIAYGERVDGSDQYAGYLSYQLPDGDWERGVLLDDDAFVDEMITDGNGNIHMIFQTRVRGQYPTTYYYRKLDPQGILSPPFILVKNNSQIEEVDLMHRASDGHIQVFLDYNYTKMGFFEIGLNGTISPIKNLINAPGSYDLTSLVVDQNGYIHLTYLEWEDGNSEFYYTVSNHATETTDSQLTQEITIPADMPSPTLSYLYQLSGADAANQTSFQVHLLQGLNSTELYSSTQNTGGWAHQFHDLSPWSGQTVSLVFTVHEEVNRATVSAHLDEITVGSAYPDIWVNTTPTNFTILPGNILQYTFLYGNQGGTSADNVTLTQLLPPGMTFVSADPAPTITSPDLVWELGALPAHSEPLTIQVTLAINQDAPSLTELTSSVTISTTNQELEAANNTTGLTVFIGVKAYLPLIVFK